MQQWYQCPKCGAQVAFGARFCVNCGTQLNWPTQQQMQPPPSYQQPQQQRSYEYGQANTEQRRTNSWLIVSVALIGVVLLIGGGIFAFNAISGKTPPSSSSPMTSPSSAPPSDSPTAPDITALIITNVVASPTETSTVITWTTNGPATSQVEYGKTADYGLTSTLKQELVVSHSITLSGLEPNATYHFRVLSRDNDDNEAASTDKTFTTLAEADTTPPVPEIEMNYSWHLASNYTSVPIYITNRSDYSVDVTIRVKTFDSQDVTIYDDSFTLEDIWPEETFYRPINATGTQTADVTVTITSAAKTIVPPISSRTDLVIVDDIPITTEPNSSPYVRIRNNTDLTLTVNVKLRRYDSDGHLRETSDSHNLGEIAPSETKLFRMEWTGGSPTPQEYFIYLVD